MCWLWIGLITMLLTMNKNIINTSCELNYLICISSATINITIDAYDNVVTEFLYLNIIIDVQRKLYWQLERTWMSKL